jgi:hypothetical protein
LTTTDSQQIPLVQSVGWRQSIVSAPWHAGEHAMLIAPACVQHTVPLPQGAVGHPNDVPPLLLPLELPLLDPLLLPLLDPLLDPLLLPLELPLLDPPLLLPLLDPLPLLLPLLLPLELPLLDPLLLPPELPLPLPLPASPPPKLTVLAPPHAPHRATATIHVVACSAFRGPWRMRVHYPRPVARRPVYPRLCSD